MTREEQLIRQVYELSKIDKHYRNKLDKLEARRVKMQHKFEDERKALSKEWCNEVKNLNPSILELWQLQAASGIHSTVYYEDIPECVKWDYHEIENKITGGCSGDWYDGCRGCNRDCHRKADEEWKKKYGFVNVKYRKYGE